MIVGQRVNKNGKQYSNVIELTQAVMSAWDSIEQQTLYTLINLMPRRCAKDIEKQKGKTHYYYGITYVLADYIDLLFFIVYDFFDAAVKSIICM